MTQQTASCSSRPGRNISDFSPARAILGKRITGVMLKLRKAGTKDPANRMFLMFDDGSGFEFFGGLFLPLNIHRDCDYKHVVRSRITSGKYVTTFFAGEPEGDDKLVTIEAMRKRKPPEPDNDTFDKSEVIEMLGKQIRGIRLQAETEKGQDYILDFIFTDGTAFELRIFGGLFCCRKPEAFDLHRLLKRGENAYESEVLVLSDPDGEGWSVVVNELYRWSEASG